MMRQRIGRSSVFGVMCLGALALAVPDHVLGSPTLTYTVTDLGDLRKQIGVTPDGHVVSDQGLAYPFPLSRGLEAPREGLPLIYPDNARPPDTLNTWYDYMPIARTNSGGSLVGYVEKWGYNQFMGPDPTEVGGILMKNAAGGWDKVVDLGTRQPGQWGYRSNIFGVNDQNQVLAQRATIGYGGPNVVLYDADSKTLIDLNKMLAKDWTNVSVYGGLAEDGRMFLAGSRADGSDGKQHALLLTPTNLSTDPVRVPEPGLVAFIACAAVGCAARRLRAPRRAA